MRHKFPKPVYAEGIEQVTVHCIRCGCEGLLRKGKSMCYIWPNGSKYPKSKDPCHDGTAAIIDTGGKEVVTPKQPPTITHFPQGTRIVPNIVAVSLAKTNFDLLVIFKLIYEDLVKHDVYSKSRQMAGRFLYSEGYQEYVKTIEKNQSIIIKK